MVDEESIEEWVTKQILILQLVIETTAGERVTLDGHAGRIVAAIEELAKQSQLMEQWSDVTQSPKTRLWIWMNTESMDETTFFDHIVDWAWLFHPHVFSHRYREHFIRHGYNHLMGLVRDAELIECRNLQRRGPMPHALEPEATVPADDDILMSAPSDDEDLGQSDAGLGDKTGAPVEDDP